MNQVISFRRTAFLLRKDIRHSWKSLLAPAGVVIGIFILRSVLLVLFDNSRPVTDVFDFMGTTLFIVGFIGTSLAFIEMHDKRRCDDFILLPASALEKTLARQLLVAFFLPLFILVGGLIASLISETINALVFRDPFEIFNPFDAKMGKILLRFFITQQVVFLGAAWFRKAHLVKTALACFVLTILFGVLIIFTIKILFFNMIGIEQAIMNIVELRLRQIAGYGEILTVVIKVLFYGLLTPFCWILAWIRVREIQSNDGV